MADTAAYSEFQKSGHYEASNVAGMQEQTSKIPVSDDALRQQAVDQYSETLSRLDQSYSKQIADIIASQASDEKLLQEQYNNSVSSMMARLQKRGLHMTPSLPQAQTAAINKHKNDVMTMRQSLYGLQREVPEQKRALLTTDYEKAINQRIAANRQTNVPTLTELLAKISDLQNSSYAAYLEHLDATKHGSGGSRRRSGGSGGVQNSSGNQDSYVNPNDLSGNGNVKYTPVVTAYYTTNSGKKVPIVSSYYKSKK